MFHFYQLSLHTNHPSVCIVLISYHVCVSCRELKPSTPIMSLTALVITELSSWPKNCGQSILTVCLKTTIQLANL